MGTADKELSTAAGTSLPGEGWLDPRVAGLPPSPTLAINERSARLAAEGRRVYKLGLGQSPFPVPDPVADRLAAHASEKDYLPVAGLQSLREAVARFHRRVDGLDFDPENIVVGPGSKELLFNIQLCLRGETLLPSPCWVSYAPQAQLVGRPLSMLPTTFDGRWRLTPEVLEQHCRCAEPKLPRLMILNYPGNPDGLTYSAAELEALAEICRRYQIVVVSDEIYGPLHHTGEHISLARYYPEGTVVSGGLSKWCGAGGWRLGTFSFPHQLSWLARAMGALASETYTAVSAPIQYAAIAAFDGGEHIERYLSDSRRIVAALGSRCAEILQSHGLRVHAPTGGFYLFVDASPHEASLVSRGLHDASALCEQLLLEEGVAVLPGHHFGRPTHEMTLRLSYVNFNGAEALRACAERPGGPLDHDFAHRTCSDTIEAVQLLSRFIGR